MNKITFYAVQTIIVWTASSALQSGCKTITKQDTEKKLKALELYTSMPILDSNGNLVYYDNTWLYYEYNDAYMYQIPVTNSLSEITVNKELGIIKDTLLSIWVKYRYFIFKKGSRFGWMYDSLTAVSGKKAPVDSLKESNTIIAFESFINKKNENDSLVKSRWIADSSSLSEIYVPKNKKDISFSDSTILTYAKNLNRFDFSLSRLLDSTKGIKLAYIRIVYNEQPQIADKYARQARQLQFKITEAPISNQKDIIALFDKLEY